MRKCHISLMSNLSVSLLAGLGVASTKSVGRSFQSLDRSMGAHDMGSLGNGRKMKLQLGLGPPMYVGS